MTSVAPGNGFLLRTPLLPSDVLDRVLGGLRATPERHDEDTVAGDLATLAARVRELAADPVVREALYVASPSLVAALDRWLAGEDADVEALVRSALSYVTRMCLRPAPFGLLAGCGAGKVGEGTLRLAPRGTYRKVTRLDYGFLTALVARIEADPAARGVLTFVPNSGMYRGGGRLRLAERRVDGEGVRYHRVAVREDAALATVLAAAENGATLDDLAKALVGGDVTFADARAYLDDLVDSQLLVSDLGPAITGNDAARDLLDRLSPHDATRPYADALRATLDRAADLDAAGVGADLSRHAAVAAAARALDPDVDAATLLQVDLAKPGDGLALPDAVARAVARAAEVLHRLHPDPWDDDLTAFRAAFAERFGDREVPLAVALDEDLGVPFGKPPPRSVEGAPLLAGLAESDDAGAATWRARDAYLLGLLHRALARGATELRITDADVDALGGRDRAPLARALAAAAVVAAPSAEALARGEFTLLFRKANGPSGAQMLGRSCHLDPAIERLTRDHVAAEESGEPDAVFAEIVHLPQGRAGNVLARPVLRPYEIPLLGGSGAPADARLPLGDLTVSLRGGRIVLRSARLGREVLPRLTSTHYYPAAPLAVYRFLASLQYQGVSASLLWRWGPLDAAPYLPRVVYDGVVLDRAKWWVSAAELADVAGAPTAAGRYAAAQRLRDERSLPRRVVVGEGDEELPVDLDTVAGTELLADAARRGGPLRLVEAFPAPDLYCAEGPEGRYAHEVVVPLLSGSAPVARAVPRATATAVPEGFRETFLPGSEWVDARLYAGRAAADAVLRDVVAPVVAAARAHGLADRWHFSRGADPRGHVGVRLHGDAPALLALLDRAAAPFVREETVSAVRVDTYRRETARYGGPEGVLLAERVFEADSDAVLAALRVLDGDAAADDRWRLALAGVDRLYDDLGAGLAERHAAVRARRDDLVAEHGGIGAEAERLAGRLFGTERAPLAALLDGAPASPSLRAALPALDHRSSAVRPLSAELRALADAGRLGQPVAALAAAFAREHVARLLRGVPRLQELVLLGLLDRLYATRSAP